MKTKYIIIIIASLIITFSCDKDEPTKPSTTTPTETPVPVLDSITREFVVFKPGSKWIYKMDSAYYYNYDNIPPYEVPAGVDSFKTLYDTIMVVSIDSSIYYYKDSSNAISIIYSSTNNDNVFNEEMLLSNRDKDYFKSIYDENTFYFASLKEPKTASCFIRDYYSPVMNDTISYTIYVEELETLTVNGNLFNNVRHYKRMGPYINNPSSPYLYQEYYWAKNIGIIKYKDFGRKGVYHAIRWWNIIDYNVQQ